MMNRRDFLQNTAAISAAGLFSNFSLMVPSKGLKKIGVQLFSLPRLLEKDFRKGIELLAQMGYKELELFGPFPFSAPSAQERWNAITPMLGFSGSGYFGHSPAEVKAILKENRIKAPAMHTDLDTLQSRMGQLGEAGDTLGFKYVILPAIPDEKRVTLDDYKKMADAFNKIGAQAKKVGLRFAYHNHGYGLQEMDGQIPLHLILDGTDPDLVFLEMDLFWTTAGGADPLAYLKNYPKRYHLMHVKDMKEKKQFSGDGGDAGQWIELFPSMTTAGEGVLDLAAIVEHGKKAGVKHFFVEQDMVENPEVALKKSFDYLSAL